MQNLPYCPTGGYRCSYCEIVDTPDQYDENGEFVEGCSTVYRCNFHSRLVLFDDGDSELLELPCVRLNNNCACARFRARAHNN